MTISHDSDPDDLGDIKLIARAYSLPRGQAKSMLKRKEWDLDATCDWIESRIAEGKSAFAPVSEEWTSEQRAAFKATK